MSERVKFAVEMEIEEDGEFLYDGEPHELSDEESIGVVPDFTVLVHIVAHQPPGVLDRLLATPFKEIPHDVETFFHSSIYSPQCNSSDSFQQPFVVTMSAKEYHEYLEEARTQPPPTGATSNAVGN